MGGIRKWGGELIIGMNFMTTDLRTFPQLVSTKCRAKIGFMSKTPSLYDPG
jgi:hypothetical protein